MVKCLRGSGYRVIRWCLLWFVVEAGLYGVGGFRYFFFLLLFFFLFVRVPYVFGLVGLTCLAFVWIFSLFLAGAGCRLLDFSVFFADFVREGVPLGFGAVVCGIELVSYLIRPLVLVLRPVVNLRFGWVLSDFSVGLMVFWCFDGFVFSLVGFGGRIFMFLVVLLYEWCVSCVQ